MRSLFEGGVYLRKYSACWYLKCAHSFKKGQVPRTLTQDPVSRVFCSHDSFGNENLLPKNVLNARILLGTAVENTHLLLLKHTERLEILKLYNSAAQLDRLTKRKDSLYLTIPSILLPGFQHRQNEENFVVAVVLLLRS